MTSRSARTSTYERDPQGMRDLVMSKDVGDATLAAASAGMAYAESIAPVDSGDYKGSFRVARVVVDVPGRYGGPRAGAVVENTAPHAHLVEHRNGDFVMARTRDFIQSRYGR